MPDTGDAPSGDFRTIQVLADILVSPGMAGMRYDDR
jgi:hypothetical protein